MGWLLLYYLLEAMKWLIIARAVVSWFAAGSSHPVIDGLRRVTDPLLEPLRRLIPDLGGVDLSPLVAYFALALLQRVVARASFGF